MTIVTNGSCFHVHIITRAHARSYTPIGRPIVTFVTRREGWGSRCVSGVGGRLMWAYTPIRHWSAMHGTQKCHSFRKTLKKRRIVNLVRIGVVIRTRAMDGIARRRTIRRIG